MMKGFALCFVAVVVAKNSLVEDLAELEANTAALSNLEATEGYGGGAAQGGGSCSATCPNANSDRKVGEDAGEAVEGSSIIAYFRHSFKGSGPSDYTNNVPEAAKTKLTKAFGEQAPEGDRLANPLKRTVPEMFKHFHAAKDHLIGNSKQVCPEKIGKMLRLGLRLTEEEKGTETFNLWASNYHRVLGTGLQMSHGFDGTPAVGCGQMPDEKNVCGENGENCPSDVKDKKWDPVRQKLAKDFLHKKVAEQNGQVSSWMVEHYRTYLPIPYEHLPAGFSGWENPAHEHDTWGISAYSYTAASDYKAQGTGCIGSGMCDICKWNLPATQIEELQKFVADLDKWTKDTMDKIWREGKFVKDSYSKWLLPPTDDKFAKPKPPIKSISECPNDGAYSYTYAGYVRSFISSHLINEYSAQVPGQKSDYKVIIPECEHGDGTECDDAFIPVYETYWPEVQRAHTIGYYTDIAVPSMALILGAIAKRAKFDKGGEKYTKMLEAAGKGAADGDQGVHEGDWEEGDQQAGVFNSELKDDGRKALLMSSHDITTNLLRIIMRVAGLEPKMVTKYNDGTPMGSPDMVTYSMMFVFEIAPDKTMRVLNFAQSPQQARKGCAESEGEGEGEEEGEGEGEGERKSGAMTYGKMTNIWSGKSCEFVEKIAHTLSAKLDMQPEKTVHQSVKDFLKEMSTGLCSTD